MHFCLSSSKVHQSLKLDGRTTTLCIYPAHKMRLVPRDDDSCETHWLQGEDEWAYFYCGRWLSIDEDDG